MAKWGAYQPHSHFSSTNITNAFLFLTAPIPWFLLSQFLTSAHTNSQFKNSYIFSTWLSQPLPAVTLIFLISVTFYFWVVGLCQRSFWLIDPYWTLIPLQIAHFYMIHPQSLLQNQISEDISHLKFRYKMCFGLILIWSLRLTHSYFRREKWKFGEREDWRYTDLANHYLKNWWWISFFAVGAIQQLMLTTLTLPLYYATIVNVPWASLDSLATTLCVTGIAIAGVADTQLHYFVQSRSTRLLDTGLWRYCRHPNYFGEQLFWWSFSLFSVRLNMWKALIGPLLNSVIMLEVTRLTENRMLRNWSKERSEAYSLYKSMVPMWIPLPNSYCKKSTLKDIKKK